MTKSSQIVLAALLGLANGYFLGFGRQEWMDANEVGRQWLRIILPCIMLFSSLAITAIVLGADWVWRRAHRTSLLRP